MYVITQKEDNYVVGLCNELIDNNDGSFLDVDEDVLYYKGDYCYYVNVEVPAGINKHQYFYTEEDGFKLAFNKLEMMQMRRAAMDFDRRAEQAFAKTNIAVEKFNKSKTLLEEATALIADEQQKSIKEIDVAKKALENLQVANSVLEVNQVKTEADIKAIQEENNISQTNLLTVQAAICELYELFTLGAGGLK